MNILRSGLFIVLSFYCLRSAALAEDQLSSGRVLYENYCEACHQAEGEGFEDLYPALKKNSFVMGDKVEVIYLLLEGRAGMPTFINDLSSNETTNVINYIRNSWGNKSEKIKQDEVASKYEELGGEISNFRSGS